jgi:hypothetical protein
MTGDKDGSYESMEVNLERLSSASKKSGARELGLKYTADLVKRGILDPTRIPDELERIDGLIRKLYG